MYEKNYFSNPHGKSLHYLVYLPKDMKQGENLPLVVFMHGAGERGDADGSELDKVAKHGYFNQITKGKEFPCIMVAPQCTPDNFWPAYIESLNKFLDYVIETYPVDVNRISLTGLSMGGTATWTWGQANPERFSAFAPVCGEGITWFGERFITKPVHTFHGDCDTLVSPHESLEMVMSINKRGGNAKITIYPRVGHNAWDFAYDDELLSWLISQKLN